MVSVLLARENTEHYVRLNVYMIRLHLAEPEACYDELINP